MSGNYYLNADQRDSLRPADEPPEYDWLTQGLARATCPPSLPDRLRTLAEIAETGASVPGEVTNAGMLAWLAGRLRSLAEEVRT